MPDKQKENNKANNKTDWGKVVKLLTVTAFIAAWNYQIWFTSLVPDNITTRAIAQSLLSVVGFLFVIAIIIVVKKKWL